MGAFKKLEFEIEADLERETTRDSAPFFRADLASQMPTKGDFCIDEVTNSLGKVVSVHESRAGYIDIVVDYPSGQKTHQYWARLKFYKKLAFVF